MVRPHSLSIASNDYCTVSTYLDGVGREFAQLVVDLFAVGSHELVEDREGLLAELPRHDRRRRVAEPRLVRLRAQAVEELLQLWPSGCHEDGEC